MNLNMVDAFSMAWSVVKMPARDRRYTVTADDVKRMQELSEQGMSQAAIWKLFNSEGMPVSRGIVHNWVNEGSRMRQREKNAKRTYIPGSPEDTMRIQRDQEKRRENWDADPDMQLRHNIQSAKDETRSDRHTVQGMTMEEAEALMESGELKRPNAKIPEEDDL